MTFIDWISITQESLEALVASVADFIPRLIGAVVVFVVGWFISVGVGRFVSDILKRVRFNQVFETGSWKQALGKADVKVDPAGFVGAVFKWVLVVVFLLAAVDILEFDEFASFLERILAYLPNVLIAALIFVVAIIIADIVEKVIRAAVERTEVGYGHLVSLIVKWSIWVFAVIAILMQLGVLKDLLLTLFTGLVAMIAIAGGLAFGLGGKEVAGEILQDLKRRMRG